MCCRGGRTLGAPGSPPPHSPWGVDEKGGLGFYLECDMFQKFGKAIEDDFTWSLVCFDGVSLGTKYPLSANTRQCRHLLLLNLLKGEAGGQSKTVALQPLLVQGEPSHKPGDLGVKIGSTKHF